MFNIAAFTNSTGKIVITVNGEAYDIVNNTNISGFDSRLLNEGHYIVTATVYENENYTGAVRTVEFTIIKYTSYVNITGVESKTYHYGDYFTISTVTNSTGLITISINGKSYVTGNNTALDIDSTLLEVGHYIVNATVYDNHNYTMATQTMEFTIDRLHSQVNVTAASVIYGNASVITVTVPELETGFVNIVIPETGLHVTVEIADGVASYVDPDLHVSVTHNFHKYY